MITKPMIKCPKCRGQMSHSFDGNGYNIPVIACLQCGYRIYVDRNNTHLENISYHPLTKPTETFNIVLGQAENDRLILRDMESDMRIWNETTKQMEEVGKAKKGEKVRVAIPADLAEKVKAIALEDGYSFEGISYVTEKDTKGKTKKDKEGKPIFKLDKDGKKVTEKVANSTGKINSAVADYVAVALKNLIADRKAVTNTKE